MKSKTYHGLHIYAFYFRVLCTNPSAMIQIIASRRKRKVSTSSNLLTISVYSASGFKRGWSKAMISELTRMRISMIFSKILLHLLTFLTEFSLSRCFLRILIVGECSSDESWLFLVPPSRRLSLCSGVSSFECYSSSRHINDPRRSCSS